MDIWNYHPVTGELVGKSTADEHPMSPGEWILPAHSTNLPAPIARAGQAIVFTGNWTYVPDYRSETWWKTDAKDNTAPVMIDFIGDPAARGLTKTEPLAPPAMPVDPPAATPHQLFTALATAMGIAPDKIDALAELAKTL